MTRLTRVLKNKIIANACKNAGVIDRRLKLYAQREALYEKIRLFGLSHDEGEVILDGVEVEMRALHAEFEISKILNDLPTHVIGLYPVLNKSTYMRFNMGDTTYRIDFDRRKLTPKETIHLSRRHELGKEMVKIDNALHKLRIEERDLENEISIVLDEAGSTTKLLKLWPEAERLLPGKPVVLKRGETKVVKLGIEKLNKWIKLNIKP